MTIERAPLASIRQLGLHALDGRDVKLTGQTQGVHVAVALHACRQLTDPDRWRMRQWPALHGCVIEHFSHRLSVGPGPCPMTSRRRPRRELAFATSSTLCVEV
jgi:hypothetical protein